MRSAWLFAACAVVGSLATPASAQTPSGPADDTTAPPPSAPSAPPPIDDPQLAPAPQATRVLSSWAEALDLVRTQSPDYLSTYDTVLRAEAQTRVALAALLPSVNGQLTFTHQFLTTQLALSSGSSSVTYPAPDVWAATGTLAWSLVDLRARHALGTAKRNVAAAEADLSDKRRTLVVAVANSVLGALAAERVAELNRVGLRAALERLALAQAKTRIGGGTELDVDRAGQDVAAARAVVISGDEALRQSREALGLALGSKVPIGAPGNLDVDHLEQAIAQTCRLNGDLERRADVIAARRRAEIAERAVDDVRLQYAPTLGVGSQLAWTNEPVFGPDTTWAVQGVLTVPIWDGGARYGLLRDARAAADEARQALTALRLNELVDVERATRAIEVSRASRDVAREERDLAAKVDARTRQGYLHGLGTSLDLVVSAQALRQSEINLVLLEFQSAGARVLAVLSNAECVY